MTDKKLPKSVEERAEKCADDTNRLGLEGDEQAIFKDGVEFGFKQGAREALPLVEALDDLEDLFDMIESSDKVEFSWLDLKPYLGPIYKLRSALRKFKGGA